MERKNVLCKGFVELIDYMGDDFTPVDAARVSLNSDRYDDEGRNIKLTKYLLDHKHTTPFEMIELKFRIKCPIFVARQWMRHRTWSYNEVSARYTELEPEFYIPSAWRQQSALNKQGSAGFIDDIASEDTIDKINYDYDFILKNSVELYKDMLKIGISKEMARIVLPVSMYTCFIAKVDLNNFLKFISLRSDSHSQHEIQVYSDAMFDLFCQKFPILGGIVRDKFFSN